uniref:Uncharacterized protein n=1 Tax=virus sp. ct6Ax4 TaxID=2826791 RepID=A0A8S5R702_9VIRU|nr:MAG TPA: hypothetical protein [virus sp. ct6Ax4]
MKLKKQMTQKKNHKKGEYNSKNRIIDDRTIVYKVICNMAIYTHNCHKQGKIHYNIV